jgi:hypothetical protein
VLVAATTQVTPEFDLHPVGNRVSSTIARKRDQGPTATQSGPAPSTARAAYRCQTKGRSESSHCDERDGVALGLPIRRLDPGRLPTPPRRAHELRSRPPRGSRPLGLGEPGVPSRCRSHLERQSHHMCRMGIVFNRLSPVTGTAGCPAGGTRDGRGCAAVVTTLVPVGAGRRLRSGGCRFGLRLSHRLAGWHGKATKAGTGCNGGLQPAHAATGSAQPVSKVGAACALTPDLGAIRGGGDRRVGSRCGRPPWGSATVVGRCAALGRAPLH